jgi:hypothetical protein
VNDRIYIHEFIDIIGHGRARYMHHMTANWSPVAQEERDQLCFGVWGTLGSTGRWPGVVNMWEESDWDGLASSFGHETSAPTLQDPKLAKWWAEAARYRSGGTDRLLRPAPWSPTITDLTSRGVQGAVYLHETYAVPAGTARSFLEAVAEHAVDAYATFGVELVGAFRTMLQDDDECIVIWAVPDWPTWARFERAVDDGALDAWIDRRRAVSVGFRRFLMNDAPLAPLRIGRQPTRADRDDDWTET